MPTFLTSLNKDDSDNEKNLIFHNIILHKEKPKRSTNLNSNKAQNSFKELCEGSYKIVQTRFNIDSPILNVAKVLNTAYFPPILTENFGESEISEFCKVFNIPVENAIAEWKELRKILSENFRPEINLRELYDKLQTTVFKNMELMSNIIQIILTIPPSNAEVERVWSKMNQILDDRSLSMDSETLQHRLQIKQVNMNLENFDPSSAIDLWWSDGIRSRRPNFNN